MTQRVFHSIEEVRAAYYPQSAKTLRDEPADPWEHLADALLKLIGDSIKEALRLKEGCT